MAKKRDPREFKLSKLTNFFFGMAIGFGVGYNGGTFNLIVSAIFIVIAVILAVIYKSEK